VQSAYFERVYVAAGFDCVLFCLTEKLGRRWTC